MSKLSAKLEELRATGEKALGIFMTSGFPTKDDTVSILEAIDAGGADFIELGMPFSDPLAEGQTIQMSSATALAGGVKMNDTFEQASIFAAASDTPIVLMGYVNPILQYGLGNFFTSCRSTGVSAVILPDLPQKSLLPIRKSAKDHGIDVVYLVAPTTTNARLGDIDEMSDAFVYAVSMTGLTGTKMPRANVVVDYLKRVGVHVQKNPVLVGFGISTPQDAERLARYTDGCIVGSAVIRFVDEVWRDNSLRESERLNQLSVFVRRFKAGIAPAQ